MARASVLVVGLVAMAGWSNAVDGNRTVRVRKQGGQPDGGGCTSTTMAGVHWPTDTSSLKSVQVATAAACETACCETTGCGHWAFTRSEPAGRSACVTGGACCWLKGGVPAFPTAPNPNCTVGVLTSIPNSTSTAVVTINTSAVAEPTDPRFVSVGVETWEWLFDPDALDNAVLRKVVTAMSPLVIRVGGISADQTHFTSAPFPPGLPWPPAPGSTNTNLLNASTFDRLVDFCRDTGASLVFDLNEMWQRPLAPGGGNTQPLNLSGVEALLRHAAATQAIAPAGPLFAVELGNELHGKVDPAVQARDYNQLRALLDAIFPGNTGPELYGPATDSAANMTQFLTLAAPARLSAFTFHSYPVGGQNLSEALLSPSVLRSTIPGGYGAFTEEWVKSNTTAKHFMSETNSDASTVANAGQDRFVNGFWYMTSLGDAAVAGMPFHVRWKLWNPRVSYRPFALNQTFGFLDKTLTTAIPELWVALLHKRLIGGAPALATTTDTEFVLAWAHRTGGDAGHGPIVMMVVNPQHTAVNVTVAHTGGAGGAATACRFEYIFSPSDGNVSSKTACFNAVRCAVPLALAADGTPPNLPARVVPDAGPIEVPPTSYGFVVLGAPCA